MSQAPLACVSLAVVSALAGACSSPPSTPEAAALTDAGATQAETGAPHRAPKPASPAPAATYIPTKHVPGPRRPSFEGGAADASPDAGAPDARTEASTGTDASTPVGWQPLANLPPFTPDVAHLLTDGTIMVHALDDSSSWWRLTPDAAGSYVNGTWSELSPMPSGYEPLFFASAVLADGRVVVIGGEYNTDAMVETPLGAIYEPRTDVWTPIAAPPSWTLVGDAPSVVLANGQMMIGSPVGYSAALFDARTLTWSATGGNKSDPNAEEGWTLLPGGKVLTVDVQRGTNSELYDPTTGTWSSAGSTVVGLPAPPPVYEIGPAMLMPDGRVFAMGALGQNAIYGSDGTWAAGPSFPMAPGGQLDIADGPAALLPNGNVLCVASPGDYNFGALFFEFDGVALNVTAPTPNADNDSSFNVFLFVLPTGQILETDNSPDVQVYTSSGSPDPAWAPTITSAPSTVVRGTTYPIHGTQLNGLSQAVAYGDDYQGATNYPLVRITNDASGTVTYGRTHDHSSMGVATGAADVSTLFEASASTPTGASHLVVVANGIASVPIAVTIE